MKKENLRKVMMTAWQITRETGKSISFGLKQAWKVFKLKVEMKSRNVKFSFTKIDGSIREAEGTLKLIAPVNASRQNRKHNDSILCYYDTVKNAWRSFRKANLINFIA